MKKFNNILIYFITFKTFGDFIISGISKDDVSCIGYLRVYYNTAFAIITDMNDDGLYAVNFIHISYFGLGEGEYACCNSK